MAHSLIDPELLPASEFNKIPDIHDQPFGLPPEIVTAIGEIFRKHNVHEKHYLQLLHRHYPMKEGCIAVTKAVDDTMSVTKLTPLNDVDVSELRGQLYFLNDAGKFQAYEYEYGSPVSFPEPFLEDLAGYITANGIKSQIALVSAPPGRKTYEWSIGSQATVTIHQERVEFSTKDDSPIRNIGYQFDDASIAEVTSTYVVHYAVHVYLHCYAKYHILEEEVFDFDKQDIGEHLKARGIILK